MARGINKVILIGNLGDEPTCRQTHGGCSVTNISMVTNEVRRSLDTGETTEYAEWHRVVMWGKLADIAKQYLHKGSQIYIEGKLRTRSFIDKQGQKRSVTEVVADEMQMLGLRPSSGAGNTLPQGNPYRSNTQQNSSPYGSSAAPGGYARDGAYNDQEHAYRNQAGAGLNHTATIASHHDYQPAASTAYGQGTTLDEPLLGSMEMSDGLAAELNSPQDGGKSAEGKKLAEPAISKMDDDIPF